MSHNANAISAEEALQKLKQGNETYLTAKANPGNVSPEIPVTTDSIPMPSL